MKKKYLIILMIFAAGLAHAQIKSGTHTIGGLLVFSSNQETTGDNDQKSNSFNSAVRYGYFVADNLVVGTQLQYSTTSFDYNAFGFGLNIRKYRTLNEKLHLFAGASALVNTGAYNAEVDFSGFNVGLNPGISYFIGDRLSLESTLGGLYYNYQKHTSSEGSGTSYRKDFNFSLLNDISFGLFYFF